MTQGYRSTSESVSSSDLSFTNGDHPRRRFLVKAASLVGAGVAAGMATPFIMSFAPSEKARAAGAPVEIDITRIEPGMKVSVEWRGKVVWALRRTPEMLANLTKTDGLVEDPHSDHEQQPAYAKNPNRSIKPEILVLEGVCTHLGLNGVKLLLQIWVLIGLAVFSVLVTVPSLIFLGVFIRGCLPH
jgi:ubiquinol-cytochrome c reductase iron-sulfur subunit